jgi:hypothetical protein
LVGCEVTGLDRRGREEVDDVVAFVSDIVL